MEKIEIEDYKDELLDALMTLFYDTVHTVNARDYNATQLDRWAPANPDRVRWKERLNHNICKVAMVNGTLAGFAELTEEGHIDTLFVHKDLQGRGVAKQLIQELQQIAIAKSFDSLTTESSITAKPFFEKSGFHVTRVKRKLHNGQAFTNYIMTKALK